MERKRSSFEPCARDLILLVLDPGNHGVVYRECIEREPKLKCASLETFAGFYVPFKLVLGCVYWSGCCVSHGISDKKITNIFFKESMNIFQGPKSLDSATRFSESLYASNASTEETPALGALVHLFQKLGVETLWRSEDKISPEMSPAFRFMVEVCEGLKNAFETKFDDFFYAQEDIRTQDHQLPEDRN